MSSKEWHSLSAGKALRELSSSESGLSSEEAERRLSKHGPNELRKEKKTGALSIFANQFRSVLVIILVAATLLSFAIGETLDAVAILVVVILNAIFGFVQEYRAEKTIEALKKLTSPEAVVVRDSRQMRIPSSELVPGDVIVLEEGSRVPADARIIESVELRIDESSITGESSPVSKTARQLNPNLPVADRKNMAWMGTLVTFGRGKAVVVATGMSTEMGRIAHIVQQSEEEKTPLQKKLDSFGKRLGIIILLISALVVAIGLSREALNGILPFSPGFAGVLVNTVMTGIALAVAAIPEGLPAVVTITLALGLKRLSKSNALVRRLPVVETLGSTTVICSDKTGTLTKNEMTATSVWVYGKSFEITGNGYVPKGSFLLNGKPADPKKDATLRKLLLSAALCNNAGLFKESEWSITGDPTEASLLVLAKKAGIGKEDAEARNPRVKEMPFSSERKMMSVINRTGKGYLVSAKGAPEKIVGLCDRINVNGRTRKMTAKDRRDIIDANRRMASDALRVLAVACREERRLPKTPEKNLVFLGLVGMIDPPREGVAEDIETCKRAGIKTVMITGDHAETAKAIASRIGMLSGNGRVLSGTELDSLSDSELSEIVESVSVYARVNPEHKSRIVSALRSRGHIIAMTGDGVNDAPALKLADIGIAMGIKGTDVSKEASDMILTDDNFTSIVKAVKEGRGIYDNIKKFVQYLLSSNMGEVLIVFIAMLTGMGYTDPSNPLLFVPIFGALQLLWINILTDALPALALGVDPPSPGIMQRPPRDPKERILSRPMLVDIIFVGVLLCAFVLFLFWYNLGSGGTAAMTVAFTAIVFFEIARAQAVRMKFGVGLFSNKALIAALASSIALQVVVVYAPALQEAFSTVPLGAFEWLQIVSATAALMAIMLIKDKIFGGRI